MTDTRTSSAYCSLADLGLEGFEGEIDRRYAEGAGLDWLRQLPDQLAGQDAELIYRLRNRIYRIADPLDPSDPGLCVKAFGTPPLVRAIYYRRHGSKAERAHRYARHLFAQGAGVAEPIGYMERWEGKRLVASYLLTRYLGDATDLYTEMTRLLREDPSAERFIALLRFAANAIRQMHDSGFVHNDLGAQNFLMRRLGGTHWVDPVFIDLNRGRCYPRVSLQQRARDMSRLEIPAHFLKIFYHLYFHDGAIPDDFARWERRYRARIRRHRATGKYRHPIRTLRKYLKRQQKLTISTGRPRPQDLWLWDEHSGQPSVMLSAGERRQLRRRRDGFALLWANIRRALPLYRQYRVRRAQAYMQPVAMSGRLGVCVEVDKQFDAQLALLAQAPGVPVLVRCYFHQGDAGLAACAAAIERLAGAGHEVAVGIVQSRQALLQPQAWQAFVAQVLARTQHWISLVEIGHAVNRSKWGCWTLQEMRDLWQGVAELRQRYPQLTFLGPAVNDFEFHYYPPLLDALAPLADGVSCHLYLDRRGAPENTQAGFSALEKCLYGKALADSYGKAGFYITETNWPLQNAGVYSPLAGAYPVPGRAESALHVDEHTSAAYMIRFALIALCSGAVEKFWWWRLAHPGFGLIDDRDGLRPRPGWQALVQFQRRLGQATFVGREERAGVTCWRFNGWLLVYSVAGSGDWQVPAQCRGLESLYGEPLVAEPGERLTLSAQPIYVRLAD